MRNYFKPISISLSPNVEKDDVILALKMFFQPWEWKRGRVIKALEEIFKSFFDVQYAFSFNSGRSSLYAILKAFNFEKGSQVMIQAFTCNAVPNPILWAGLEPIYVDCNMNDFNISLEDLQNKLTEKSKAVIVQHTFGLPADIENIKNFCNENNLILIEDCAHALGAEYHGKKLGTFGDVAFFSFARDKVISCVYGGMAITNNDEIGRKLRSFQEEIGYPGYFWIFQQLFHPIFLHFVILPMYAFLDLGKIFLVLSQYLHIVSKAVSWKEKRGQKPDYFPKALPNALSIIAVHQFKKLDKFNRHRKEIAEFYFKELSSFAKASGDNADFILPKHEGIFLRFSVRHKMAHRIIYKAWHEKNILLGDWYTSPVAPDDTNLDTMKYKVGSCKNAENLAKETFNLPTHINISRFEAERIIRFLYEFERSQ